MTIQLHTNFTRKLSGFLATLGVQSNCTSNVRDLIGAYVEFITKRCDTRGVEDTIRLLKDLHLIATKVAMGRPFQPLRFIKSDKQGLPSVLTPMLPLLRGTNEQKRIALSITSLYKVLRTRPDTDTSSITTPCTGSDQVLDQRWHKFLTLWVKKFKPPRFGTDRTWRARRKMGPNGPALSTCHLDAAALSNDKEVLENLRTWFSLTEDPLSSKFEEVLDKYQDHYKPGLNHSALTFLSELGGKTRVVAIVDYFTQEALYPIFRWSMDCLKQLETDGTYDQSHIVRKVRDATLERKPIHCLDLRSATDRFPVTLQEDLLGHIIGRDRAKAWRNLLCNRDFASGSKMVRYEVGQPMGILSSWSVFALTHHAIVEYSAKLEGFHTFKDYVLLGDDIAIFNTEVANRYTEILDSLGVTISHEKSFSWVPGDNFPPSGEIAKRLIIEGEEVTPFPVKLLLEVSKSPIQMALTLRQTISNMGIDLDSRTWDTLSQVLAGKRQAGRFNIIVQAPLGLTDPDMLARPNALAEGVTQGTWSNLDFSKLDGVLDEIVINNLNDKVETMMNMFYNDPLGRILKGTYKSKSGEPMSNSVLDLDAPMFSAVHPMRVVIDNLIMELPKRLALLAGKLESSHPEFKWSDFDDPVLIPSLSFERERRRKNRQKAKIIPKIFTLLSKGTEEVVEKSTSVDGLLARMLERSGG